MADLMPPSGTEDAAAVDVVFGIGPISRQKELRELKKHVLHLVVLSVVIPNVFQNQ